MFCFTFPEGYPEQQTQDEVWRIQVPKRDNSNKDQDTSLYVNKEYRSISQYYFYFI